MSAVDDRDAAPAAIEQHARYLAELAVAWDHIWSQIAPALEATQSAHAEAQPSHTLAELEKLFGHLNSVEALVLDAFERIETLAREGGEDGVV